MIRKPEIKKNSGFKIPVSFLLIFALAAFLRLWQLGDIPVGVSNDEASYIYSAYSIWKSGRDIQGKWFPLSFQTDNSLSPVPIYLNAPVVGIFGITPFTGRFLYALAGIGTVILVSVITYALFQNIFLSELVMAVIAVSPWQTYVSRTAYESGLALFFILLGTYLFIKRVNRNGFVWSIIPFAMGFYSYHATKIFLVGFIPLLLLIYRKKVLARKTELIAFISGFLLILILFFYITKTQAVTRQVLFLWNYMDKAAATVLQERTKNTAPFVLREIFNNKLTYFGRLVRENYLEAFSPQYLFLYGETGGLSGLYGVMSHGVLYLIELPLLCLGIITLSPQKKYRQPAWLIFGGLLLAPLTSAFTVDKSYAMRAIMMVPFLYILIGYGLAETVNFIRNQPKIRQISMFILLASVYGFFILSYFYQYFYRFPIYDAETWFRSSRDLVSYIRKNQNNYDRVILVNNGDLLIQFAFFNNLPPQLVRQVYAELMPKNLGNITFINGCFDTKGAKFIPTEIYPPKTLYIVPEACHKETPPFDVIREVGEPLRTIWKIYQIN
jgi:4-amino-4-deoxy-L-arabinose transferase-like glycosyltransferase